MDYTVFFLIICSAYFSAAQEQTQAVNSDVGLNEKQLMKKHGYSFENHRVKTEDGYILKLFRIPSGRTNSTTAPKKKYPVLIVHGILSTSSVWILMGPQKGIAYLLADKGYDVWLANLRGSTWSRRHEKLKPDQDEREFWDYSFHEMGFYDLPATIDYILKKTHANKLHYICHSQGCTSFFAMASTRPEYNSKIRLMVGLAPVTYLSNMGSPLLRVLLSYREELQAMATTYKLYDLLTHTPLITVLAELLCNDGSPIQGACANGLYFIVGFTSHFNQSMIPVLASTVPAGLAFKEVIHHSQVHHSKEFQHFDYGETENMIKYNQTSPPRYDLSKVTAPVALYYADNDLICADVDVQRAASELPNVVKKSMVSGFNHLDFNLASDTTVMVYNDVFELMRQYE